MLRPRRRHPQARVPPSAENQAGYGGGGSTIGPVVGVDVPDAVVSDDCAVSVSEQLPGVYARHVTLLDAERDVVYVVPHDVKHRMVAVTDPTTGLTVMLAYSYGASKLQDAEVPTSAAASRVLQAGPIIAAAGLAAVPASAAATTRGPPIRLTAQAPRMLCSPLRFVRLVLRTAVSRAT